MSQQDHVYERRYANLTSPQLHRAAMAQVVRYSRPPSRALRGRYALLRDAWQWVADHHRPSGASGNATATDTEATSCPP